MLSLPSNGLSSLNSSLQKPSNSCHNPETIPKRLKNSSNMPTGIIKIDSNSTKRQIMKQKNSIFITDSKTPSNLIKFLQEKNLNYIGSDCRYYQVTKDQALIAAASSGLMLPKSAEAFQQSDLDRCGLDLPLMIKPNREVSEIRGRNYNSLILHDQKVLKAKTEEMIQQFGGVSLEEYVPGREVVCLCYSNGKTLSPLQFNFEKDGPKYVTFELQNDPIREQWYEPCTDEQLSNQIRKSVQSFFKIIRLSGEFLFHLRVNGSKVYLIGFEPISFALEEGSRPLKTGSVLESILFHNGLSKKDFLQTIIESASLRREKNRRLCSIQFNEEKNVPVLYAQKSFQVGEQIYEQQNARQNIVIVDWLKNHFDKISWGDFWSRNSEGWKPISHSCQPNAQVQLNGVKAIKRIGTGEEITVDFATIFYHQRTFECTCKTQKCRKVINLRAQRESWFHQIPSSQFHPWMMDYMFKETLINILNDSHDIIRLEYSPGDCYAVAKRDIKVGQKVVPLDNLPIQNFNTRHSITKNQNEYYDTKSSYGQFTNHKCSNYNLIINQDSTSMVSTVPIPKGQMLTFNYITTQWDICFPFSCGCGQSQCYGYVKGFKDMSPQIQKQTYNIGHCSQFVNNKYNQSQ